MQLHVFKVDEIIISANRQRKEFTPESLLELAGSITQNGLLHPVVVRREGDRIVLVAGERRIRALHYVWQFGDVVRCGEYSFKEGEVPAVYLGELDALAAEEAELEENIQRQDLSWQERAAATSRLTALKNKLAQRDGVSPPTIAELTEEVRGSRSGSAQEETRKELIVARYLDDEDVVKAKNVDDAFKILKRKEATKRNVELAAEIGKTFSAAKHSLYNEDCRPWLRDQPAETFDVVLSDPPYGMGADEFGDAGGKAVGAHGYADSYENWQELFILGAVCQQLFRVAKSQAHCYLFCDVDRFQELRHLMVLAGWKVFRTPLIWHKPTAMRAPWPLSGPLRRYELILYAVKGDRQVTRLYPDVVSYASDDNLGHAAQKPVGLFLDLLRRSVKPGDTVLDFACGTGPIFPACHELQCIATGVELDPAAYAIAAKRLGELK